MSAPATWASGTNSFRPVTRPDPSARMPMASGSSAALSSRMAGVAMRSPRASSVSNRSARPRAPTGRRLQENRRRDHRARDVGAGKAGAPHLLHQEHHVEERAVAPAEGPRHQQTGPAEGPDLLPEIVAKAPRIEGELLHQRRRAALVQERSRRAHEELLRSREGEVHGQASGRAGAGRRRPRTAIVVRRISDVPPAIVWPRLTWYWCWMSPPSLAHGEPSVSGP